MFDTSKRCSVKLKMFNFAKMMSDTTKMMFDLKDVEIKNEEAEMLLQNRK